MQEQITAIQQDMKEVKEALLGTEFNGGKGLVHEVNKNTSYRKSDTKQKYYVTGGVGVVTFFATFFRKHIIDIFAS